MATASTISTRFGAHRDRAAQARPGYWARLRDSFAAWRMRAAEREIARFIALNGGAFTDSMERRIEQRLKDWA